MFSIICLILFFSQCCPVDNQSINFNVVQEVVEKDFIKRITIYHCSNDITTLGIHLMKKYRSLELFHINSNDSNNLPQTNEESFERNLIIILDLDCLNGKKIIQDASNQRHLNKKTKWLLFGSDYQSTINVIKKLDINIDTIMLLFIKSEHNYSIFHIKAPALRRNGIIYVNMIGTYSIMNGIKIKDPFKYFNYTLDGTMMNVGISINVVPKGAIFQEYATKHIISNQNSLSRAPYQVLLLISQKYNFRMHLKRTPEYGKLIDNGTRWTGLMGYLQRKEVDFTAQSFVFSLKRMPSMDSGFSATKYRHFFVFRHPDTHSNMKNPFLRPLNDIVWLLIVIISLLTILALFIIKQTEESDNPHDSLILSILNVVGIFSLQGLCEDIWSSFRARIILLFMLMLSFILYQLYGGAIVGALLAPPPRTITTLEKLTESGMKIILEETASNRVIFTSSYGTDLKDLYQKRVKGQEVYVSIHKGLQIIRKKPYVFLTNVDESYEIIKRTFTHEEKEKLQEIAFFPKGTIRAYLYIPIQKQTPFSELIRVGVLRLTETGIKPHVVKQWELKLPKSDVNENVLKIIDIEQTVSVFILLLIGQLAGLLIFFVEALMKHIQTNFA